MLRRLELVCGMLAALVGLLAWIYVLVGPLYAYSSTTIDGTGRTVTVSGSGNLAQRGLELRTLAFLVVVLLCALGAGFGAYLHAGHGDRVELVVLFLSAALLQAGALLSIFSVGLFLVPAALLAVIAATAGAGAQAERSS